MKVVNYFVVGIIAISLFGCSGESGDEPLLPPFEQVDELPIAWGAQTGDALSRALVTDDNIDTKGNAFSVFGSYDIATNFTNPYNVFDNRKVYYDGSDWTYDSKEFWVDETYYRFRGFYPYTDNSNTAAYWLLNDFQSEVDSCYLYLSVDDPAKQVDLMVSDVVERGPINTKQDEMVEEVVLTFNHLLTNVHFKLKKHANDASNTLEVQSVRLKGMYTRALFAAGNNVKNGIWYFDAANEDGYNRSYATNDSPSLQTDNTHQVWGEEGLLLIPQTITNNVELEVSMKVTKTMDDGTVVTSLESPSIPIPTTQHWPAATKLTYVATIGSDNSIQFATPIVQPWIEEPLGGGVIIQ